MKMGPARHDVLKNLPAAAVGDETQLQAEVLGKLQHGHMGHVAGRGDAHDVLVGVLFRHFDKFVDVLPRGVLGGHQNHGLADGRAYEVERIRPVGKLHHMRLQTHGPGGHIAERVAVRFGGGHLRHPERAARAGSVLHDDGLSKPLFHHPRQQTGRDVRAAARAERDDQRDRVIRIGGQRPGGPEHEHAKEEKGLFHHLADHTALLFCYRLWTVWAKPCGHHRFARSAL